MSDDHDSTPTTCSCGEPVPAKRRWPLCQACRERLAERDRRQRSDLGRRLKRCLRCHERPPLSGECLCRKCLARR